MEIKNPQAFGRFSLVALTLLLFAFCFPIQCKAAPPVRIAVVPSSGSGMEQAVADAVSTRLQGVVDIVFSTVNPDWYVVCNIVEQTDPIGGSVKVNGTATIKTTDGQVINVVAVQTNKQDFSLQPGASLNKEIVQSADREIVSGLTERVLAPIQDAVAIEMETRDKIIDAQQKAQQDQYDPAIAELSTISPDTPHFRGVQALIGSYQMEKTASESIKKAKALAQKRRYGNALEVLAEVDHKSKRYKLAKELMSQYRASLSPRLGKVKQAHTPSNLSAQLQALNAQKKALDAQTKAIEVQEASLKAKSSN